MLEAQKRIGILSGLFDPVHDGHTGLALEALEQASLDEVYFLVEAKPWRKTHVTHLAHRVAMIKLDIKTHTKLHILDLPDKQFSVAKTLPRLKQRFPDDELFFIAGSDMLEHMPTWPLIAQMLKHMNLIIALRGSDNLKRVNELLKKLPSKPQKVLIIKSKVPGASSGTIRQKISKNQQPSDLSPVVLEYIKANWLYASPSNSSSAS